MSQSPLQVIAYQTTHRVLGTRPYFFIFVDEDSPELAFLPGDLSDEALTEACKAMGYEVTEIIRTCPR